MQGSPDEILMLATAGIVLSAGIYLFKGFFKSNSGYSGLRRGKGSSTPDISKQIRLLENEERIQSAKRSEMKNRLDEIAKKQPKKIADALQTWLLNGNGYTTP